MTRQALAFPTCLAALALAGAPAPQAAQKDDEQVVNPYHKHWSAFKTGTTVTTRETTKYAAGSPEARLAPDGTDVKEVTYKLAQATADKVVVETVVVEHVLLSAIEQAPTRITYPAKVKKSHLDQAREALGDKGTDEELKVAGKTVKCRVFETTFPEGDGLMTTQKTWISNEVPGGIAKRTRVTHKGKDVVTDETIVVLDFKTP
jgi:hypothetical protein